MEDKLLQTVTDELCKHFNDPIDIECSYCEAAKAVIPLVRADVLREIGDWLKGTCQYRVPFHARWHCAICKNRLLVALKSGTFKAEGEEAIE